MRKFTLFFIGLFVSAMMFAQYGNPMDEVSPNASNAPQHVNKTSSKGNWTVQFTHNVKGGGTAGCETDGTYFYVTVWNGDSIFKYDMQGNYVGGFTVTGVNHLRDLAYDGTYFYGGKSSSTIYKMRFDTTAPYVVSTISTPVSVRNICYDPAADNGNGGFWIGNWSTDLKLVSRTGTTLATIPSTTHNLKSTYGTAYDTISPGGPYIWAISAGNPANTTLFRISVATGQQTITHDLTTDVCQAGEIGGGLWIEPGIVSGTVTLGGLIQNTKIFGFDLATTVPDTFDIGIKSLNIPNKVPIGQNVDIKGDIDNPGSSAITSYDLHYSVDGGAAVTQNVTGVNIPAFGSASFTHSTPWTPTSGIHTIKVWTTNPNGHADQNTSNDTMIATATGYNAANAVPRTVLMETFTSSTCGPCVNGNVNITQILNANQGKWACIKYQMSWPGNGDPYYTLEGGVRRQFYGVNSVPRQEIDGGYDGNSSSVTQADFDAAYNTPAFVGMDAYMVMDTVKQHLTVGVNIDPKMDLPSTAKLFIGIVERKTTKNVGSNGETAFFWVMKKMIPDANGTSVPATSGTPFSKYFNYTFNGSYRLPPNGKSPIDHTKEHSVEEFSDLVAICWIQNSSTKEVYQACISSVTLGMAENHPEKLVAKAYPNPATSTVNFDLNLNTSERVSVEIVSMTGQKIKDIDFGVLAAGAQKVSADVTNFESGIYFFRFKIGNALYVKPVTIR